MNKAYLIGNLATDPEIRTTQQGHNVCTFRIAVQRRVKNADGTHDSDFIPVVAWRQLADLCHKYLHKGSKAAIVGAMQTRSYDAQDGSKRYITEVIADEVEFLDPREKTEKPAQKGQFTEIDESEIPF